MSNVSKEVIEILIKARNEASAAFKEAQKGLTGIHKDAAAAETSMKKFDNASMHLEKTEKRLEKAMFGAKKQFQGWALSIMFLGMALSRVFNQIWKSATKTFQDVTHSMINPILLH
jgi:hypothetical protein